MRLLQSLITVAVWMLRVFGVFLAIVAATTLTEGGYRTDWGPAVGFLAFAAAAVAAAELLQRRRQASRARGALVVLTWVLWPPVVIVGSLLFNLFASHSRACSIEGCNTPLGVGEVLFVLVPPVLATIAWWRWRRRQSLVMMNNGAPSKS